MNNRPVFGLVILTLACYRCGGAFSAGELAGGADASADVAPLDVHQGDTAAPPEAAAMDASIDHALVDVQPRDVAGELAAEASPLDAGVDQIADVGQLDQVAGDVAVVDASGLCCVTPDEPPACSNGGCTFHCLHATDDAGDGLFTCAGVVCTAGGCALGGACFGRGLGIQYQGTVQACP